MPEGHQDNPPKRPKESQLAKQRRLAEEERKRQERRRALKLIGAGLGLTALAGTGAGALLLRGDKKDYSSENKSIKDISENYPEILGEKIQQQGEFQSLLRNVRWYSFSSKYSLDPNAAQEIYTYFDLVGLKNPTLETHFINGAERQVGLMPMKSRNLIIFLVDRKGPKAHWLNLTPKTDTYTLTGGDLELTRIGLNNSAGELDSGESGMFQNDIVFANQAALLTEAFMASVSVGTERLEDLDLAQETVGNRLGQALAFRQQNIPYDIYSARTKTWASGSVPSGRIIYQPYAKDVYEAFPKLPQAIKPR